MVTGFVLWCSFFAHTIINRNQLFSSYLTPLCATATIHVTPTKYHIVCLTPSSQFDVSYVHEPPRTTPTSRNRRSYPVEEGGACGFGNGWWMVVPLL
jgi:hypothetical protein